MSRYDTVLEIRQLVRALALLTRVLFSFLSSLATSMDSTFPKSSSGIRRPSRGFLQKLKTTGSPHPNRSCLYRAIHIICSIATKLGGRDPTTRSVPYVLSSGVVCDTDRGNVCGKHRCVARGFTINAETFSAVRCMCNRMKRW